MFQNIVGSGETEEVILNKDILIWHTSASELCIHVLRKVWFLLRYIIVRQLIQGHCLKNKQTHA